MATFAFIHGAGDVGWYWHLVEAELRLRGHDTVAPDLPIEDDKAGLTEYATAVIDAIGDRHDAIVGATRARHPSHRERHVATRLRGSRNGCLRPRPARLWRESRDAGESAEEVHP